MNTSRSGARIPFIVRVVPLAGIAALGIGSYGCASLPDITFVGGSDGGDAAVVLGVPLQDDGGSTPDASIGGGDDAGAPGTGAGPVGAGSSGGDASDGSSGGGSGAGGGPGGGPGSSADASSSGGPGPGGGPGGGGAPGGGAGPDSGAGGADGCPATTPPGADTCCTDVPCVGMKCAARCGECGACAGEICCVPNGNGQPIACVANVTLCGG